MTVTTPTLTDRESFLRAIAADPDADLPRLAFADWLDEHGTEATDAARAELIRVQVDLATYHCSGTTHTCYALESGDECLYRCEVLKRQQKRLLAAHERDWRRGPKCEKCGGSGWDNACAKPSHNLSCPACHGTGDGGGLMRLYGSYSAEANPGFRYAVHFDRGFLTRVEVPTLAELVSEMYVGCERCNATGHIRIYTGHGDYREESCTCHDGQVSRFEPSPLLRAIVGAVPGSPPERMLVREVVAMDRKPIHRGSAFTGPNRGREMYDWSSAHVPDYLFNLMASEHPDKLVLSNDAEPSGLRWLEFATEADAVTALARAVATWGRTAPEAA